MKRTGVFLLLALSSGASFAQAVVNGDFSQRASSWSWKDAEFANNGATDCGSAAYVNFLGDTRWVYPPNASGWAANLTGKVPYAKGEWTACRQIEQTVYVPAGSQLSFSAKIGDDLSPYDRYRYNSTTVSVIIKDAVYANSIISVEGRSYVCNSSNGCLKFQPFTVGLSPYWGKTVTLIVRATGYAGNNDIGMTSQPSSAFVDNIVIQ